MIGLRQTQLVLLGHVGVPPVDGVAVRELVGRAGNIGRHPVDRVHPPAHAAMLLLGQAGNGAHVHAVARCLGVEGDAAAGKRVIDGRARLERQRGRARTRAGGRAVNGDVDRDARGARRARGRRCAAVARRSPRPSRTSARSGPRARRRPACSGADGGARARTIPACCSSPSTPRPTGWRRRWPPAPSRP